MLRLKRYSLYEDMELKAADNISPLSRLLLMSPKDVVFDDNDKTKRNSMRHTVHCAPYAVASENMHSPDSKSDDYRDKLSLKYRHIKISEKSFNIDRNKIDKFGANVEGMNEFKFFTKKLYRANAKNTKATVKVREYEKYLTYIVKAKTLISKILGLILVSIVLNSIHLNYYPQFLNFLEFGQTNVFKQQLAYKLVQDPRAPIWEFFHHLNVDIMQYVENGFLNHLIAVVLIGILYVIINRTLERERINLHANRNMKNKMIYDKKLYSKNMYFVKITIRILGIVALVSIIMNITSYFFGGWNAKAVLFPDIYIGHLFVNKSHEKLFSTGIRNVILYIFGFFVDSFGFYLKFKLARNYCNRKIMYSFILTLLFILSVSKIFLTKSPACNSVDNHWLDFAKLPQFINTKIDSSGEYPPVLISDYIQISENFKVAVDIALPKSYYRYIQELQKNDNMYSDPNEILKNLIGENDRIPTVLNITRYNKATQIKWPFTMVSIFGQPKTSSANIWSYQMQQAFVSNGYAVVHVDTRGTGVTPGKRIIDFSHDEINDIKSIVSWLRDQWWSNGKVASGGVSYDGMTGILSAANANVDAVLSLFAPMDVIKNLISPGGIICSAFINDYTGLTKGFEKDGNPYRHILNNVIQYPAHIVLGFLSVFGGPVAVKGHKNEMAYSMSEHHDNWEMGDFIDQVSFMDDELVLGDLTRLPIYQVGIKESIFQKIAEKHVDAYIIAGYCDSTSVTGASELYSYLKKNSPNALTKFTLGSWTHGGKRTCSPSAGSYSCFEKDIYFDAVRFLDCSLKGKCWGGIRQEKPVHFWQSGREEWMSSDAFPPIESSSVAAKKDEEHKMVVKKSKLYLSSNKFKLSGETNAVDNSKKRAWPFNISSVQHFIHDFVQIFYFKYIENSALYSIEKLNGSAVSKNLLLLLENDKHSYQLKHESQIHEEYPTLSEKHELDERDKSNTLHQYGNSIISYDVDYTATSGKFSRWFIAQHPFGVPVHYGNRLLATAMKSSRNFKYIRDWESAATQHFGDAHVAKIPSDTQNGNGYTSRSNLLYWTTERLAEDFEIVGDIQLDVSLYLNDGKDAYVFAYLEDVDLESGFSSYVSEGNIMPTHRKVNDQVNFTRDQYRSIGSDGEVLLVKLNLQPLCYTFKKNHAIRLVLAGNDADNFDIPSSIENYMPKKWHVLAHTERHKSTLNFATATVSFNTIQV